MNSHYALVVDDDDVIRDLTVMLLESEGYSAVPANHGLAALEAIRRHGRPAVILLDLRMPVMNGEELLRRLQSIPELASIPVIVLSGDRAAAEAVSRFPLVAVLTKPYDVGVLLRHLRALMPALTQHP